MKNYFNNIEVERKGLFFYSIFVFVSLHFVLMFSLMPWLIITDVGGDKIVDERVDSFLAGGGMIFGLLVVILLIGGMSYFFNKNSLKVAFITLGFYFIVSLMEYILSASIIIISDYFLFPTSAIYSRMLEYEFLKTHAHFTWFDILLLGHPLVLIIGVYVFVRYIIRKK